MSESQNDKRSLFRRKRILILLVILVAIAAYKYRSSRTERIDVAPIFADSLMTDRSATPIIGSNSQAKIEAVKHEFAIASARYSPSQKTPDEFFNYGPGSFDGEIVLTPQLVDAGKPVVEWINTHFDLATPITIESVVNEDPERFEGCDFKCFPPDRAFRTAQIGKYIDPQAIGGRDGYIFEDIARLSRGKLRVEAHRRSVWNPNRFAGGMDYINYKLAGAFPQPYQELVVNNRLYAFEDVSDGGWFSVVETCDMLNAIAGREKLDGRFFVMEVRAGYSYVHFVFFGPPTLIKEAIEKFDFQPLAGCQKLWRSTEKSP